MLLAVMGLLFQLPIGIIAVTRLGDRQHPPAARQPPLRDPVIAIVAMLLPGTDPVTMLSMMVPLLVLYEGSILFAALLDRRASGRAPARRRPSPRSTRTTWTPDPPPARTPMLFDLRGSGRRRTVKVVYVTLAVLMGGGLVLFGIGGASSGGLVDAITESSGGGDTGTERLEERERAAARRARANPTDAAAWAALARARFNLASAGDNLDQQTGTYSAEGQRLAALAGDAWERHVELARQARRPRRQPDGPGLRRPRRRRRTPRARRRSSRKRATAPARTRSSRSSRTSRARRARATSPAARRSTSRSRTCARALKGQLDAAKAQATGASGASGSDSSDGPSGSGG